MTATTSTLRIRPDDRYPSRVGTGSAIRPRVDPVVWGHHRGPLHEDRLAGFAHDGFLQVPGLFSTDEVEAFNAELDRLARDEHVRATPQAIIEPDSAELRSVFDVHRSSTVFQALSKDPRLVEVARQLLGSDVYIHQSRVNLKPGFRGREFYWHSDFETWHTEDGMPAMRAVSCSVVLTDNHHVNGPLMVIAGSHKWYVSCSGETPADHHEQSLRKQEVGTPDDENLAELCRRGQIHGCTGRAGSVTFFDCNAMHGSNGNITPLPRRNAFLVFNSVENALTEPFAAPAPRPTYIASRDFTPVVAPAR